jgi:hypothetical protein
VNLRYSAVDSACPQAMRATLTPCALLSIRPASQLPSRISRHKAVLSSSIFKAFYSSLPSPPLPNLWPNVPAWRPPGQPSDAIRFQAAKLDIGFPHEAKSVSTNHLPLAKKFAIRLTASPRHLFELKDMEKYFGWQEHALTQYWLKKYAQKKAAEPLWFRVLCVSSDASIKVVVRKHINRRMKFAWWSALAKRGYGRDGRVLSQERLGDAKATIECLPASNLVGSIIVLTKAPRVANNAARKEVDELMLGLLDTALMWLKKRKTISPTKARAAHERSKGNGSWKGHVNRS